MVKSFLRRVGRRLLSDGSDGSLASQLGVRPLPEISVQEAIGKGVDIQIRQFSIRLGNVSPLELMVLGGIVAARRPRHLLEIGTFDGNTTLQLAANAPPEATVYTLDLPVTQTDAVANIHPEDAPYIASPHRAQRRFVGTPEQAKIRELYGDSGKVDFAALMPGTRPDFIFIDGSHSYHYARNDTEKSLKILADHGTILWHDYTMFWADVPRYLGELSLELPLFQITGTTLVCYKKA